MAIHKICRHSEVCNRNNVCHVAAGSLDLSGYMSYREHLEAFFTASDKKRTRHSHLAMFCHVNMRSFITVFPPPTRGPESIVSGQYLVRRAVADEAM